MAKEQPLHLVLPEPQCTMTHVLSLHCRKRPSSLPWNEPVGLARLWPPSDLLPACLPHTCPLPTTLLLYLTPSPPQGPVLASRSSVAVSRPGSGHALSASLMLRLLHGHWFPGSSGLFLGLLVRLYT